MLQSHPWSRFIVCYYFQQILVATCYFLSMRGKTCLCLFLVPYFVHSASHDTHFAKIIVPPFSLPFSLSFLALFSFSKVSEPQVKAHCVHWSHAFLFSKGNSCYSLQNLLYLKHSLILHFLPWFRFCGLKFWKTSAAQHTSDRQHHEWLALNDIYAVLFNLLTFLTIQHR